MSGLLLHKKKNLKISNVIIRNIDDKNAQELINIVELMDSYIKSKGALPIGPLIQYTNTYITESGELDISIQLMRQSSNFIYNIETPYRMESIIRIKNCMYVRFIGDDSKLKFAYDKINLAAFEEDIALKGGCYTIFVDKQDDNIIADVFMERADNE